MLKLDHLTVIAPSLAEGVAHVRDCLGLDVPFGTRHAYMGTHNHRLRLGTSIYLEIVARDPAGTAPARRRWFGLDDDEAVRADWQSGRRLRGWVASTAEMEAVLARHGDLFGEKVALPDDAPDFAFAIPADGSLPMEGAAPSLIDHWGDSSYVATIPDLGVRLVALELAHPEPDRLRDLYARLAIDHPPEIVWGPRIAYRAMIDTPGGIRELR